MNLQISNANKEEEYQSLKEIFNAIEENLSILFNSGAGAGKTYALIESMKFITNRYGEKLKSYNQNIMCITYTNVATKEVIERLGNSNTVLVSTIHERLWDLIKEHQEVLVEIHKRRIINEISSIKKKIETEKSYEKYEKLTDFEKETFTEVMEKNKEIFYKTYSLSAKEVKGIFVPKLSGISYVLNNVNDFKKTSSALFNLKKLENCLINIESNKPTYKKVEYDPLYNSDQLHRMKISHDTLLDYGIEIIENHDILKRIIIDKYPYIFIDEYQDTDEKVIKIMNLLEVYSQKINRNILIAYFGDSVQNIYDNGIGDRIREVHPKLKLISKNFNRRSSNEVIEVINRIRNDQIKQKSIYNDFSGGSVKFCCGNQENVQKFISECTSDWDIDKDNPLHCFLLTNKTVAEFSGFINIYSFFKSTKKYSGNNFNQLNTELMSNDPTKLGEIPKILYNIIEIYNYLQDENTPLINILKDKKIYNNMSFSELSLFIESLKEQDGNTLDQLINSIEVVLLKSNNRLKDYFQRLFGLDKITKDNFKNLLIDKLFDEDASEKELCKVNEDIEKFLNVEMNEFNSWYRHVSNINDDKTIYHTYHGTKGLQFDNVAIIMQNSFGKIQDYFSFFFENYFNFNTLNVEDKKKFVQARNLIYVSCSRAVKNIRILYLNDITNFEGSICEIFGKPYAIE